jgi:hypothetical protein
MKPSSSALLAAQQFDFISTTKNKNKLASHLTSHSTKQLFHILEVILIVTKS